MNNPESIPANSPLPKDRKKITIFYSDSQITTSSEQYTLQLYGVLVVGSVDRNERGEETQSDKNEAYIIPWGRISHVKIEDLSMSDSVNAEPPQKTVAG